MADRDLNREIEALQRQIDEADKEYQGLLDAIGDSILLVDFATSCIVDCNSHAARRLGYSHEELIGMNINMIETIPPDDFTEATPWTSHLSSTDVYECLYRHKDGSSTAVEVSSRLVRFRGKAVIIKVARDITLRKALEFRQRQMIDDLESYAHSVAHDLKNPIAILMGYSDLVLTDPDVQLPKHTEDLVTTIYKTW